VDWTNFLTERDNAVLGLPRADILDAVRDRPGSCGQEGATGGCVRSTVVDGRVAGYRVGVVSDCCFDRFEASHWMSLFDMNQKYADVIDVNEAEQYLRDSDSGSSASSTGVA
jgi:hypothetical protein